MTVVVFASLASSAYAAEPPAPSDAEKAAIRASADEFVAAFNRGDAKAVAALWTPDGTMTDERGETFSGQSAIEAEYAKLFTVSPGAKMELVVEAIDLAAPGVAIEEGLASVTPANGSQASASHYRAVHTLQGGKWRMASVREAAAQVAPMKLLGWLAGKWQHKSDDAILNSSVRWIAGKEFLQRDYVVKKGEEIVTSGTQIIGFDPQTQSVRSWSFDSSGGHGTSLWTATSDGWQIDTRGTLPDGTPTSSIERVIRVPGEDRIYGWQSVNRHAGNVNLPDTEELVMERATE